MSNNIHKSCLGILLLKRVKKVMINWSGGVSTAVELRDRHLKVNRGPNILRDVRDLRCKSLMDKRYTSTNFAREDVYNR